MYPRTNYEMTQADLDEILEACKPVPMIMLQGGVPRSPQENANRAWEKLGVKMGFDHMTVQPTDRGDRFFTAVPSETETARAEREKRESEEARQKQIQLLKDEISERQTRLQSLENGRV